MVSCVLSEDKSNVFTKLANIDCRLKAFKEITEGSCDGELPYPKYGDNIVFSTLTRENIGVFPTLLLKGLSNVNKINNISIAIFYYEKNNIIPDIKIIKQKYICEFDVDYFIRKDCDIVAIVYYIEFKALHGSSWVFCDTTKPGMFLRLNDMMIKSIFEKRCY
jgi:hypothetical protein